jgi:prepilin-type processing-associated H-X9-DG protein
VTEIGWVADLVNSGTLTGKMLCPSNASLAADTYNDLLGVNASGFAGDGCVNRMGNAPVLLPDNTSLANPCWEIASGGSAGGPAPARTAIVERRIYKQHYNTNYTASWFLVRSDVNLDPSGNLSPIYSGCGTAITSRNVTRGPLRRTQSDTAKVSTSLIPLLGDGASSNRTLTEQVGNVVPGTLLTASYTAGPVLQADGSQGSALTPPVFPGSTPKATWWAVWNRQVLQDYRNFSALHRGSCNVLFADGSVRTFTDANRDGLLNNGFGAVGGFGSNQLEVGEDDLFSKYSVDALKGQ